MRNTIYQDYKIFTGNADRKLAEEISSKLGKSLGKCEVKRFSDGEIAINMNESVRGVDCYIIQSTCNPVNDNLMEILIMIDSMKRASAGRINVVMPYYGYARQDRKAKARHPSWSRICSRQPVLTVSSPWTCMQRRSRATLTSRSTTSSACPS